MEDSKQSEALSLEQFKQIMDKLSRLDNQMQEHFGNLTSEISTLRYEMKQELDGVKRSLRDVEKAFEEAWDSINDIREETKPTTTTRKHANKASTLIAKNLICSKQTSKKLTANKLKSKFENKAA